MTARTRSKHDVYDMTEGSILVRGTLDPTEALKLVVDAGCWRVDHFTYSYSDQTPESGRALGDVLLAMLASAKPGLYRRNPVAPGTWQDDEGWGWQLGYGKEKGHGTFEGVLFP